MNRPLKILLLASALFTLAGGLIGPLYAVYVQGIGGDLITAGTSYGIFAIAAGALIFLISRIEDRTKHLEYFVIGGYLLSCLGYLGYLLIREPWHLFIVQIIFGLGEAIGTPAYDGVYSANLEKGKFASQWGMWESMKWIVTAIAATIGGIVASQFGFKTLFIVMFCLSAWGLAVSSLLLRNLKRS